MQAPAGWYPDPTNPRRHGYWDGTQWTGQWVDQSGGDSGIAQAFREFGSVAEAARDQKIRILTEARGKIATIFVEMAHLLHARGVPTSPLGLAREQHVESTVKISAFKRITESTTTWSSEPLPGRGWIVGDAKLRLPAPDDSRTLGNWTVPDALVLTEDGRVSWSIRRQTPGVEAEPPPVALRSELPASLFLQSVPVRGDELPAHQIAENAYQVSPYAASDWIEIWTHQDGKIVAPSKHTQRGYEQRDLTEWLYDQCSGMIGD